MFSYEMKTAHIVALRIVLTLAVVAALVISGQVYKTATPASQSEIENASAEPISWHDPDMSCYLTYAEVASIDDGCTTFITRDGNLFSVSGEYTPDLPYMLTMYDFHTSDVTDDCVCVVWVCAEGVLG